jgi:hypothetical protein
MQIIHDFKISPVQYYINGQDNDFPIINKCPKCHNNMIKHGFYARTVITIKNKSYIIFIRRYRCKNCDKTISILPSFLLPYFQLSLFFIFYCLEQYFLHKNYVFSHRQTHIYCTRFRSNIPGIISYFRDQLKFSLKFDKTIKKKTIKLLEMIKSSPTPTFSRRYHCHSKQSFMAL